MLRNGERKHSKNRKLAVLSTFGFKIEENLDILNKIKLTYMHSYNESVNNL